MTNRKVILEVLEELHKGYDDHLYDFMQNETHAQFKLFEELNKRIKGNIYRDLSNEAENDQPISPKVMKGKRVRLEVQANGYIHDICIVKEGATIVDESTIETVIEVKHGYGYCNAQMAKSASV